MKKVVISILVVVCLCFGGYYIYKSMNGEDVVVDEVVVTTNSLVNDFKNTIIGFGEAVNDLQFVQSVNYTVEQATTKIEELANVENQIEELKNSINNSEISSSIKEQFNEGINQITTFIQEQIDNFQKIINK